MKLNFFSLHALLIGMLLFSPVNESSYSAEDKYQLERRQMVTIQIDSRHVSDGRVGVKNESVLEAMLQVPRPRFVPQKLCSRA